MKHDSCSWWKGSWAPNLLQQWMGNKDDDGDVVQLNKYTRYYTNNAQHYKVKPSP